MVQDVMKPKESLKITKQQIDLFLEWFKRFSREKCIITCVSSGDVKHEFKGTVDNDGCKVIEDTLDLLKIQIIYNPKNGSIFRKTRKRESLVCDFVLEENKKLDKETFDGTIRWLRTLFPTISDSIINSSRVTSEAVTKVIN